MDRMTKEHKEELLKNLSGEKTLYPSQVNTKTISCRISSADYVSFLQDAISKGITLNDWLLMKIYSKSLGKVAQIEEKGGEMEDLTETEEGETENTSFPMYFDTGWGEVCFNDESEIESFLNDCYDKLSEAWRNYNFAITEIKESALKAYDLDDKTNRILILSNLLRYAEKLDWESAQDLKETKKDIRALFRTLFD